MTTYYLLLEGDTEEDSFYETNVLGSKGPRRMKVLMPMVNRDG